MKNGTIVLIGNRKWAGKEFITWLSNVVTKSIVAVTGSRFIHIKRYLNGYWYESSFPKGAGKTTETFVTNDLNLVREPIIGFTEEEVNGMVRYAENKIAQKMPYNILKLLVLAIVLPLRKFFKIIKWVPFEKDNWFGAVCSVFDDQMVKSIGIDQFLNEYEEYTPPGWYTNSPMYKDI